MFLYSDKTEATQVCIKLKDWASLCITAVHSAKPFINLAIHVISFYSLILVD